MAKGFHQLDNEVGEAHRLRAVQGLLYEAGKIGDTAAAPAIIHFAMTAGVRPVDILVGLIAPLLHRIGSDWERGEVTIADEHRFSSFCEHVFKLIRLEVIAAETDLPPSRHALVLLFNARGNIHTLGIRILALWLQSKGIETRVIEPPPSTEELTLLLVEARPRAILISIALERQKGHLYEVVRLLESLPLPRPLLMVGGHAVKQHLIATIAGSMFIDAIIGLDDLIWSTPWAKPDSVQ